MNFNEEIDKWGGSGSGTSWTTCKSFTPHSGQTTVPAPQCSYFLQAHALLDAELKD